MSWKTEVIADSSGSWTGNGLRFATESEANDYVSDLYSRWSAVQKTRVVEVDEPVTHIWHYGKTHDIATYQPDARVQGAFPKFDS